MFRDRGGSWGQCYTLHATGLLKTWGLLDGELQLACNFAMSKNAGGRNVMREKTLTL